MASSKNPRSSSCSFLNLLLSFLNFILFILSAVSFAPTISLKMPPTSLGWAFLMISSISLLSSLIGFYSQLARFCYITHVSLLLASSTAQLLGILALFTKEKSSLEMLKSPRDPREVKVLVRLECGVLMAMFVMQLGVLILCCAVQRCWVREYEGLEAEREAVEMKRWRKIARVQEESMANAAKIAQMKSRELDEKMKSKYGKWMKNDDVEGNTAAARTLVGKCSDLLYVKSNSGLFPVHKAAISAHKETLEFLISQTNDALEINPYAGASGLWLLCFVIDADFFDIASRLIEKYPQLATIEYPYGYSALKTTALNEFAFLGGARFNFWERLIYSSVQLEMVSSKVRQHLTPNSGGDLEDLTCSTPGFQRWHKVFQNLHFSLCKVIMQLVPRVKRIHDQKLMHHQALELVKCLCNQMEKSSYNKVEQIFVEATIVAARLGIHEVIEMIVEAFPAAILAQEANTEHRIFDLAVKNRSEKVFNLIYQMSDHKHRLVGSGTTILHLAAGLAPSHKLNQVSGAALQMQRELQWFKEVEKIVHPTDRSSPNLDGKTPKMIFTEEHKDLKKEGEKWMKDTANSCTIAAALIATVVFAAAITVPGGNKSETGYPMFFNSAAFIVFAVSDAVSLFASTTSLLMFLSVLTSRYAEEDFLHALPKRLCIGLFTLFVSILFMMVAFSATLYLVFCRKSSWVLIPVAALACTPISSFVLLQFPLLVDVVSSTYGRGIFGKQSDRPFY